MFSKSIVLFFSIAVSVLVFAGCSAQNQIAVSQSNPVAVFEEPQEKIQAPFTAQFEIYTLGTKRIFSDEMYLNASEVVYLRKPDPSIIHVQAQGITWQDFFDTLPFSIDSECLVTGTNQTFCNNNSNSLQFYLNEKITNNVLEMEINPNDVLVIRYE